MSRDLPLDTPIHASAVAFENRGLLLFGPSGSGKSGLALELMAYGATLVSDDRVILSKKQEHVHLNAIATISGKIEARGIGILSASYTSDVMLYFIADLATSADGRLPAPVSTQIAGHSIATLSLGDHPRPGPALWQILRSGALP